jgi:hypothetical protein
VKNRKLRCACCGYDAGTFQQFHNQDTGFGLCGSCATWISERGMSEEELNRTYGKEGVHRPYKAPKQEFHP